MTIGLHNDRNVIIKPVIIGMEIDEAEALLTCLAAGITSKKEVGEKGTFVLNDTEAEGIQATAIRIEALLADALVRSHRV